LIACPTSQSPKLEKVVLNLTNPKKTNYSSILVTSTLPFVLCNLGTIFLLFMLSLTLKFQQSGFPVFNFEFFNLVFWAVLYFFGLFMRAFDYEYFDNDNYYYSQFFVKKVFKLENITLIEEEMYSESRPALLKGSQSYRNFIHNLKFTFTEGFVYSLSISKNYGFSYAFIKAVLQKKKAVINSKTVASIRKDLLQSGELS
jgi:hypothetical protein